jgi:mannosyltransferase OCH1-like enzyme
MPIENIEILTDDYVFPETGGPECIPRVLHMIWVGGTEMPDYARSNLLSWCKLMPHWSIRLWTNSDIPEFPEIADKIHETEKGVQKADLLFFHIMEKYGGIYVDTDVTPHRSLDPIIEMNRPVVACNDIPFTWAYCSKGFFAVSPHHPSMKYACEKSKTATVNTSDIHMHTGPRLFGDAVVSTCTSKNDQYTILPCKYFYLTTLDNGGIFAGWIDKVKYYRNSMLAERFGTHEYRKEWTT